MPIDDSFKATYLTIKELNQKGFQETKEMSYDGNKVSFTRKFTGENGGNQCILGTKITGVAPNVVFYKFQNEL